MKKIIRINKIPDHDTLLTLLELMTYYHLSYPVGTHRECEVQLDDAGCKIHTPDTTYSLADEVYLKLYLLSNKSIANMYKLLEDDQTL